MIVRSVVGVLMLAFVGFMASQDHIWFTLVIIFGQILTWKEVVSIRYKDVQEQNLVAFRTLNWYWLFVAFYFFYGKRFLVLSKTLGLTANPDVARWVELLLAYHPSVVFGLYTIGMIKLIHIF